MVISELKQALNIEKITHLLETMGCQAIKIHNGYITSTRGNGGDNLQGIICYTNDKNNFNCLMPTSPQFDKYYVKDIISVVQVVKDLTFPKAVKYICEACGIDYYQSVKPAHNSALEWLQSVETGNIDSENYEQMSVKEIDEKTLNQFVKLPHIAWLKEAITSTVCNRFGVGYDIESNSITIPIRDELGNLVGVKCRTMNEQFDSKYWYMYPTNKNRLLFGEFEGYDSIIKSGYVIVVEGEKSVLKGHSFGIDNIVAISGKKMSEFQAERLLRMNVPIILALDNDVKDEEIKSIVEKLKYPIQTVPVYTLKDKFGLYLGEHDAPADNKEFLMAYKDNMLLI